MTWPLTWRLYLLMVSPLLLAVAILVCTVGLMLRNERRHERQMNVLFDDIEMSLERLNALPADAGVRP